MSLTWALLGYKDSPDPDLKKYLEIIVFGTMFVDIGEVSEKTLDEWLFRIEVMRKLKRPFGTHFVRDDENGKEYENFPHKGSFQEFYPEEDLLRKFFGLRTNVFTLTRTKWLKNVWTSVIRDCERDAKHRRPMTTQENAA